MTTTDFYTSIRNEMARPTTDLTDVRLNGWLDRGERKFEDYHNWSYMMQRSGNITLPAGLTETTRGRDLSASLTRLKDVIELFYVQNSVNYPIVGSGILEALYYHKPTDTGPPVRYVRVRNTFYFYPLADVAYTLGLWFYGYSAPPSTSPTTETAPMADYPDYIKAYALMEGWEELRDEGARQVAINILVGQRDPVSARPVSGIEMARQDDIRKQLEENQTLPQKESRWDQGQVRVSVNDEWFWR